MSHNHSDLPDRRALLIAVQDNSVQDFPLLYHAHSDAKALKSLLIETYGYSEGNITLMMDHPSHPKHLWPTKSNIRKQILRFTQGVSAGDHLFFYYSGHGHQVPCHHNTEPDGLDEAIFSCNGKLIIDNELKQWLVVPLPPGSRLFALWDSCHSHTILDLDHYKCNEPGGCKWGQRRVSSSESLFRRVFWKRFRMKNAASTPEGVSTVAQAVRGRPATRASVSITALSAGNSPPSPSSKWIFFPQEIQRVLSPVSIFTCNGDCPPPPEGEAQRAHVISLSACKDNELAADDSCNGTVTKFFIDHLREEPKSTLEGLLLALRERVGEITAARQEETKVISRRTTFSSGSERITTEWIPGHFARRRTEVNFSTVDELLRITPSSSRISQQPSYSSQYRLDLNELVDL